MPEVGNFVVDAGSAVRRDPSTGEGVEETEETADEADVVTRKELAEERQVRPHDGPFGSGWPSSQNEPIRQDEQNRPGHSPQGGAEESGVDPIDPHRHRLLDLLLVWHVESNVVEELA